MILKPVKGGFTAKAANAFFKMQEATLNSKFVSL